MAFVTAGFARFAWSQILEVREARLSVRLRKGERQDETTNPFHFRPNFKITMKGSARKRLIMFFFNVIAINVVTFT